MKEMYKVNGVKYYHESGTSMDDMILRDDKGKEWTWLRFFEEIYNKQDMKKQIQERITTEDFVMELVGTKRILELVEKHEVDTNSKHYSEIITKTIERLKKEL